MTEMLVHVSPAEIWVALVEDGLVVELHLEPSTGNKLAGNIFKGRVEAVLPGMQAAFVDVGLARNGFLVADQVRRELAPAQGEAGSQRRIEHLLQTGQELLVQVTREPMSSKGAGLSTNIALPGHILVLLPYREHVGVSRRIDDEGERERLRQLAADVRPQGMGIIVRTAGAGRQKADLRREVGLLKARWEDIQARNQVQSAPSLLYQDLDLVTQSLRDLFSHEVDRVVVDGQEARKLVESFLRMYAPRLLGRVQALEPREDLIKKYNLEEELERALRPRVWLQSGGFLVIDHTEALTTVDVNSGKFVGKRSLADTVHRINREAAAEIPRQLRLRNIGGMVIIDFIDMQRQEDRQEVLDHLASALEQDRTRTHLMGLTRLGLVELTRKKVRMSLREVLQSRCACCGGSGRVPREVLVASRIQRALQRFLEGNPADSLRLETSPTVASFLLDAGQPYLESVMKEHGCRVVVSEMPDVQGWEYRISVGEDGEKPGSG